MDIRGVGNTLLQELILERQHKESSTPTDPHHELHVYLSDPLVPQKDCTDELMWWKVSVTLNLTFTLILIPLQNNSLRYPILCEMATNYFGIQASSVPCEQLFSSAGLVDTKRRNHLGAERFGSVEYVKGYFCHLRSLETDAKTAESNEKKRVRDECTLAALDMNK